MVIARIVHVPLVVIASLLSPACADRATGPTALSSDATSLVLASPTLAQVPPGGIAAGLKVWLRASVGISAVDDGPVFAWADQSGTGRDATWNVGNTFFELPPAYDASNPAAGGEPAVRFNAQNALEIDLAWLSGSDYTIVVVNGRNRGGLANFYIAGDAFADNRNLVLGYERTDLLRQAHFNNDLDAVVEDYTGVEVWSLDTYRFAQAEGRDLYHNGSNVATDDNAIALISNTGSTLGHFRAIPVYWFQGDIAEVVIYNRALTWAERLGIEAELAGRYGRLLRLEDYVPCEQAWRNHGDYVSTHARAVRVFVAAGLLTAEEGAQAQSGAAESSCGR